MGETATKGDDASTTDVYGYGICTAVFLKQSEISWKKKIDFLKKFPKRRKKKRDFPKKFPERRREISLRSFLKEEERFP